jgi:hypothetical protein
MTTAERSKLISRGARIKRAIKRLQGFLDTIEETLERLPKGTYKGDTPADSCQVIDQKAGETKFDLEACNEEAAREICGPLKFRTLFERRVVYSPCDGFALVAARVLRDKAAALLTLCAKPGKAGKVYVRWV